MFVVFLARFCKKNKKIKKKLDYRCYNNRIKKSY